MSKLLKLLKNDILLTISFILAVISAFIITPDKEYLSYINFPVLVLLFCLMVVVAGFRRAGVFFLLQKALVKYIKTEKMMIFSLCMICFFASSLITNDVALITFVPFTLVLLKNQKTSSVIFAVVMETISANLGSLVTPIGNPQNLYIYTHYNVNIVDFFKTTLPLGIACLLMILACLIFRKNSPLNESADTNNSTPDKKSVIVFLLLFILCILSVLNIVSCYITLVIVFLCILFKDRSLLKEADYILLLTFVFFFVFAGNIARIPAVYSFISKMMSGREILMSALISQAVSNVPAAAMLSAFTEDFRALLLGTNIGGLGTLIASMASLISYRFIAKEKNVNKKKFMLTFTVYNVVMLIVLLLIFHS